MDSKVLNHISGDIHYWVSGSGSETILFTHGVGLDHSLFKYQVKFFSEQYKVITWDVPCHGKSRPNSGLSFKISADIIKDILDKELVEKVHLVGHSMGGYIVQTFYTIYSDRVKTLTTIGSNLYGSRKMTILDVFLLKNIGKLLNIVPHKLLLNHILRTCAISSESIDYAAKCFSKYKKSELISLIKSVYLELYKNDNKLLITAPLLFTYGELDKTGRVDRYAPDCGAKIPNASHNSNLDNYSVFNQILLSFLKRYS